MILTGLEERRRRNKLRSKIISLIMDVWTEGVRTHETVRMTQRVSDGYIGTCWKILYWEAEC